MMTSEVQAPATRRPELHRLYAPVAEELAEVEQLLGRQLRNPHPAVDEVVRYAFRLGGKRLRPALVLLAARAIGNVTPDHIILATVVEMIHTATLLHDDVLDEADKRRHLPTANLRWGNEASILAGDYLFSQAFYLSATLETTFACQAIGRSTNTVCEGELRQVASRGNWGLDETEYLQMIDAKTAALTACSAQLGAYYAGAGEATVEALEGCGRDLGIAFQIADDLLDVVGDETSAGKSLGSDLENQKLTLPWIRLLSTVSPEERQRLEGLLTSDDRPALLAALRSSDGLEYAYRRATDHARSAAQRLTDLPDGPATDVLRWLTEFVIRRDH